MLEDLEKKLSRKAEGTGQVPIPTPQPKSASPQSEPPRLGSTWGSVPEATPKIHVPMRFSPSPKAKKIVSFGVGFAVILIAGFFVLQHLYAPPKLDIAVSGPREVKAGEVAEYEVTFDNKSRSPIKNATFAFRVSSGAAFVEAENESVIQRIVDEELAPGTSRKAVVSAVFWGKQDESRQIAISFRYQLGDLQTRFETTKDANVRITASAASLEWELPGRTIPDDAFIFKLKWKNEAQRTLADAKISIDFPENFSLLDAIPKAVPGIATWELKDVGSGKNGDVRFVGKVTGSEGEARRFRARLDVPVRGERIVLQEVEGSIGLTSNPLSLAVSLNNEREYTASLNEPLTYRITFKNNFDIALRDVVVKAKLEGPLFGFGSIETEGSFSSRDNTITWHGGNTPQLLSLNAQESGMVSFRVKTRDVFPQGQSQNVLKATAEISSPTKPPSLGGAQLVSAKVEHIAKINGKLVLESRVLRKDPQARFTNTGPTPPRVNQATQYAARLKVTAQGNDFKDVFVRTALPANVTFSGRTSGTVAGTNFVFNPRTNEIMWEIPELGSFQSREIIFQIAATPSAPQVGSTMVLLDAVEGGGVDEWTGNEVVMRDDPIASDLPDDPNIGYYEGVVQP